MKKHTSEVMSPALFKNVEFKTEPNEVESNNDAFLTQVQSNPAIIAAPSAKSEYPLFIINETPILQLAK